VPQEPHEHDDRHRVQRDLDEHRDRRIEAERVRQDHVDVRREAQEQVGDGGRRGE